MNTKTYLILITMYNETKDYPELYSLIYHQLILPILLNEVYENAGGHIP